MSDIRRHSQRPNAAWCGGYRGLGAGIRCWDSWSRARLAAEVVSPLGVPACWDIKGLRWQTCLSAAFDAQRDFPAVANLPPRLGRRLITIAVLLILYTAAVAAIAIYLAR